MGAELWSEIFLVAFIAGLLATVAMLVLGVGRHGHAGHGHGHGAHAGHGHAAHNGHAHSGQTAQGNARGEVDAAVGRGTRLGLGGVIGVILPLTNLPAMLALLTAGGAAGWIALRLGVALLPAQLIALGVGLIGAQAMAVATRLLVRAEAGVVVPRDERGTAARVIAAIGPGRVGEIVIARDGKRQALPARGEDERVSAVRGDEVVVMRIERGVAYVQRAGDLFDKGEGR